MKVKYKGIICCMCVVFLFLLWLGNIQLDTHNVIQRYLYEDKGILMFQQGEDVEAVLDIPIGSGREKIEAHVEKDNAYKLYFFLPSGASMEAIEVIAGQEYRINEKDTVIKLGKELLRERIYFVPLQNVATGEENTFEICLVSAEKIPTIFLTTENTLEKMKENKRLKSEGEMRIFNADGEYEGVKGLKVKGHGNGSWNDGGKKSWRLQLDRKDTILGLTKGEQFVALSNVNDRSHMRNKITFDMAQAVGLPYVPQSEWANLYINGNYQGLYLIADRIEVSEERVAIKESREEDKESAETYTLEDEKGYVLPNEDDADLTTGYMFREYSKLYHEMDAGFLTEAGNEYEIVYPKVPSQRQLRQLKNYVQEFHDAIQDENGYSKKNYLDYMDLDSFVKKYLIEEVAKNRDGNKRSSYYYIYSFANDSKIIAGPVWDYDIAYGNTKSSAMWNEPQGITKLNPGLDKREEFMAVAIQYYKEIVRPYLTEEVDRKINGYDEYISSAAYMDQMRWYSETVSEKTYDTEVDRLRKFIAARTTFLDDVWLEGKSYYRINYVSGEEIIKTVYLEEGSAIDEYVPESEDKTFVGWYDEELSEPIDLEKPLTDDMALWAKWE